MAREHSRWCTQRVFKPHPVKVGLGAPTFNDVVNVARHGAPVELTRSDDSGGGLTTQLVVITQPDEGGG